MTRVTIVIPVLNGGELLADQLASLRHEGAAHTVEIIVADNGSTDDTVKTAVARCGDERVQLIDASGMSGPGHARNVGANHASGDILLFCDADDCVRTGWLDAMVNALETAHVAGGPAIQTEINQPRALRWYRVDYVQPEDDLPEIFLRFKVAASNNMGFRTGVFRELGGFDAELERSGEDLDLSIRASRAGYHLGYAPDAVIDYRLRDQFVPFVRQRFNYGRGWADVYFKHEDAIPLRQGKKRELRLWLTLLGDLPRAARQRDLGQWAGRLALNLGRLSASLQHRKLSVL